MSLYSKSGERLYLTANEREAFLRASRTQNREVRTFCIVLHDTGCRLSEALALTPQSFDFNNQSIIFETLKKRQRGVFRAVPVPLSSLDTINVAFDLLRASRGAKKSFLAKPLWNWSRTTGYRRIIEVMEQAGIEEGSQRSPKGLRHGFGVHALNSAVPLNMLSKWMGHSSLEVTAIYANALGEEERAIASRMWDE